VNRLESSFVAIDAIAFASKNDLALQLRQDVLMRELNKAYIGFQGITINDDEFKSFENEELNKG
jgi:hypothetical protein